MHKCLFIGGSADGRVIEIEHPTETYRIHTLVKFTGDMQYPSKMTDVMEDVSERYERGVLIIGASDRRYFYYPEGGSPEEAIRRVWYGYSSLTKFKNERERKC